MSDTLSPSQQAELLLQKLLKGKEMHDLLARSIRENILINGESMSFWEKKFKLQVQADNLNPSMCKELGVELLDMHQDVAFFYAIAQAKLQMIKTGGESIFRDLFFALVQDYKSSKPNGRLPAKDTLENLAKIEQSDIIAAQSVAEMEMKFWKDILNHLDYSRKIIENATWNNKAEADLNQNRT